MTIYEFLDWETESKWQTLKHSICTVSVCLRVPIFTVILLKTLKNVNHMRKKLFFPINGPNTCYFMYYNHVFLLNNILNVYVTIEGNARGCM